MTERRATYRLQLNRRFDFAAAADVAGYLAELGVSHVYTSPITQAAAGSSHGYDGVDPTRISEELGGEAGFASLVDTLSGAGLGLLVDIVPNHTAAVPANPWWWDVLERGRGSRHAPFFDIDWDADEPSLCDRVLMPILGDQIGRVIARGEVGLGLDGGRPLLRYADMRLPLSAGSLAELGWGGGDTGHRLAEVEADHAALLVLLDHQHYRLAHWRLASEQLNYRRFLDISSLVGMRVEDEAVFDAMHERVLRLVGEGRLDGVRVDHVDGLCRPAGYLGRLRDAVGGDRWVVVEKILAASEALPPGWPVEGTTGYDFAARVTGLFVDPRGEAPLTALLADLTGERRPYAQIARDARREVMRTMLAAETERLTRLLARVCAADPEHGDHPRGAMREALIELGAGLTVYRTYGVPGEPASDADVAVIRSAVGEARRVRADLPAALLDLLADVVLGLVAGPAAAELMLRFAQTAVAVSAKGLEDTAFYRYPRLLALNEVGADPGCFGVSVEAFHAANQRAQAHGAFGLVATSTHDSKRGEDVRARLALLSEIPDAWAEAVRRWSRRCERHRTEGMPDRLTAYVLFQTLVGAHPLDAARAVAYMEKATREAKLRTSWLNADARYDAAVRRFTEAVLADQELGADIAGFVGPLVEWGRSNSLAQTLLKLTSPGVPDIYQGCELWDLSLVDPDNRRPVDFGLRRRLLARAGSVSAEAINADADSGLPKLYLIRRALELRARRPADFGEGGDYLPLPIDGERSEHGVAFARGRGPGAVTVVPRLVSRLGDGWGDTTVRLPAGRWHNQLTGESVDGGRLPMARLLARFPVALLSRMS
ncbi:MAG: malto-oligosyltrehalose synthase [Chloroflexi bacterium]|nr:MAG: malto-oligosyltrehalose synthase [Chloroflexota bacterium]